MSDEPTHALTPFERMVIQRFDQIDGRLDQIDVRLDHIDMQQGDTNERLEKLEAKALDTRPIWERALAEILEVKEHLELIETENGFLHRDIVKVRARQERLEKRINEMEETKPI